MIDYASFGIGHAPSPLIRKKPPQTGRSSATQAGASEILVPGKKADLVLDIDVCEFTYV